MDKNTIINTTIKGFQASKIFKTESTETILITLEKGTTFPTHTSPKDALLVVLQGEIVFYIHKKEIVLTEQQTYSFLKDIEHYVVANKDAKFLIIR